LLKSRRKGLGTRENEDVKRILDIYMEHTMEMVYNDL